MLRLDFKEFQEKVSGQLRPWQRSFQFWVRAVDIYTGYKVFQVRVNFEKDAMKREAMWENQHQLAASYNICPNTTVLLLCLLEWIGALLQLDNLCYILDDVCCSGYLVIFEMIVLSDQF
ncbi:Protein kinase superfamily protein [Perilla frutescens var. hirtella]|uniref:Protein kinase superfamily protein n=1 Tax=Perilla frutescens var. hirtella TaxID=608512 RepID=A0AAD4IZI6_PERFH|nr:Protein kinase superfamily protein [Perilla frutescens var. hirtella]